MVNHIPMNVNSVEKVIVAMAPFLVITGLCTLEKVKSVKSVRETSMVRKT